MTGGLRKAKMTARRGGASSTPQNGMMMPRTIGPKEGGPPRALRCAVEYVRADDEAFEDDDQAIET